MRGNQMGFSVRGRGYWSSLESSLPHTKGTRTQKANAKRSDSYGETTVGMTEGKIYELGNTISKDGCGDYW